MRITMFALMGLLLLAGCATEKKSAYYAGGSKADGVVYFDIKHKKVENINIDYAALNKKAQSQCIGWGYNSYSSFGSVANKTCNPNANALQPEACVTRISFQCINR